MKASAIQWPTIQVGQQTLIVQWTFYVQFLLSKRKVDVRSLPVAIRDKQPELISVLVECFAAAVAGTFRANGLPAPDADYWAETISELSQEDPGLWLRVNQVIWEAVRKVTPATPNPVASQETAQQPVPISTTQ